MLDIPSAVPPPKYGSFPTTRNPNVIVIAAPTDPRWKSEYDKLEARRNDPTYRGLPNYNFDNDLCGIQSSQNSRGFVLASIYKSIYGFYLRTVFAGGISISSHFETFEACERWAIDEWYLRAPDRRELIDGVHHRDRKETPKVSIVNARWDAGIAELDASETLEEFLVHAWDLYSQIFEPYRRGAYCGVFSLSRFKGEIFEGRRA
jgi:hypothetical protein